MIVRETSTTIARGPVRRARTPACPAKVKRRQDYPVVVWNASLKWRWSPPSSTDRTREKRENERLYAIVALVCAVLAHDRAASSRKSIREFPAIKALHFAQPTRPLSTLDRRSPLHDPSVLFPFVTLPAIPFSSSEFVALLVRFVSLASLSWDRITVINVRGSEKRCLPDPVPPSVVCALMTKKLTRESRTRPATTSSSDK